MTIGTIQIHQCVHVDIDTPKGIMSIGYKTTGQATALVLALALLALGWCEVELLLSVLAMLYACNSGQQRIRAANVVIVPGLLGLCQLNAYHNLSSLSSLRTSTSSPSLLLWTTSFFSS